MEADSDTSNEDAISYEDLAKEAMAAGALDDEVTEDEEAYALEKQAGLDPYQDPAKVDRAQWHFEYVPPTREKFNLAIGHLLAATLLLAPFPVVGLLDLKGVVAFVPLAVFVLIVVGLPLRAARSRIVVRGSQVTVYNPFRTYRYNTSEVKLAFRSFGNVGTAQWVPYGSPDGSGETLATSSKRPALLLSGKKNPVKIAAMRSRTESSVEVANLAQALAG